MIISNAQARRVLPHLAEDLAAQLWQYVFKSVEQPSERSIMIEEMVKHNVFESFSLMATTFPLDLQEAVIDLCCEQTGVYFHRDKAFDKSKIRRYGLGKLIQDELFCGEMDFEVIIKKLADTPEMQGSTSGGSDVAFVKTQLRKAGYIVPVKNFPRKRRIKAEREAARKAIADAQKAGPK